MTPTEAVRPATGLDGRDLLVRNSVLLMATQVAVAGLGFVFWVAAARLFSAPAVGLASTLLAALNLLSFLSLGGLNETVLRFLGAGEQRSRQVTQGVLGVAALGLVLGLGYAILAPAIVGRLDPTLAPLGQVIAFALASSLAAVNLFTDSVFIGLRAPGYNVAIDGFVQSLTKLGSLLAIGLVIAPTALVSSTWAMVVPMILGFAVATLVSLIALRHHFGVRFRPSRRSAFTRREWRYSAGLYAASVLDIAPLLIVPLVVLRHQGAAASAYYFTAMQLAGVVHGFLHAIGQSGLSEASNHPRRYGRLGRRTAHLCLVVAVPGAIGLATVGPVMLRLFGSEYATHGRDLLIALAVATVPVALTSWAGFHLRARGNIRAAVASTIGFVVTIVALSLLWSERDLAWIGWAWCAGWTVRAGVCVAATWWRRADLGLIATDLQEST